MDFETEKNLLKTNEEELVDLSSVIVVAKAKGVHDVDFENTIQFIGETGEEFSCTYDKFVEIFDKEGLSGFIM